MDFAGCPANRRHLLLPTTIFFLLATDAVADYRPFRPKTTAAPSRAISAACAATRYRDLCLSSHTSFPGAIDAGEDDIVHVSINMTLSRLSAALSAVTSAAAAPLARAAALDDCLELLDSSVDLLSRSLLHVSAGAGPSDDVLTWLSAALTNQDTCTEGFGGGDNQLASFVGLSELVSNSLAIFAAGCRNASDLAGDGAGELPRWLGRRDRRLMAAPATSIRADMVVARDGSGTHRSISDAVAAAPENSPRRIVIRVMAGRYDENVRVGRRKKNLMFVGDGKGATVVAAGRSVADNYTTYHTATFAAMGEGLIMRDMTVVNWAGPEKHQAVALRVGGDRAAVYRVNVIGYQDTLYAHSQRQFYRECDVYGTVDFVFGNAAVVLQNCSLWARRPLSGQKNTVTAQNRKDPNQNTGVSIHACRILPAADLAAAGGGGTRSPSSSSTYLGRPWKPYSRVVTMMSYIGGHVHPAGWLEWNGSFAIDTLYYGEYMNYGPGAATAARVDWPGFHVIGDAAEAEKFTVAEFISGDEWLPATGVSFLAGLSV